MRWCIWLVRYGGRLAIEGGGCKCFPSLSLSIINLFSPSYSKVNPQVANNQLKL